MNNATFRTMFILLLLLTFQNRAKAQQSFQSNVYFEGLGLGGLYSINYEARFGAQPNNIGFRAGLSYTAVSNPTATLFTIPTGINYLLGKDGKYFELGAGATYATASLTDLYSENGKSSSGSTVFGTLTFGYRSQPANGGFMFRAGFSPVFGSSFFYAYWPYASVGYSF